MEFFIWNIKTLFFFKFFRVNPGWPLKPGTRPLGRVNPRAGFNNYGARWGLNPRCRGRETLSRLLGHNPRCPILEIIGGSPMHTFIFTLQLLQIHLISKLAMNFIYVVQLYELGLTTRKSTNTNEIIDRFFMLLFYGDIYRPNFFHR
jgi:hypothetical protein